MRAFVGLTHAVGLELSACALTQWCESPTSAQGQGIPSTRNLTMGADVYGRGSNGSCKKYQDLQRLLTASLAESACRTVWLRPRPNSPFGSRNDKKSVDKRYIQII